MGPRRQAGRHQGAVDSCAALESSDILSRASARRMLACRRIAIGREVANEATGIHRASRRRGGVSAAAHAQPAACRWSAFSAAPTATTAMIDAIWQGSERIRLRRRPQRRHRIPLAEGQFDRLPALAADLVRRQAAVIVAIQSVAAPIAAKAATHDCAVVFSIGGDPVKLGLVSSLNRPGGNVTGATFLVNTLSAKRLELLHDLLPDAKVMGLLVNPKNPAAPCRRPPTLQAAARTLGLQLHRPEREHRAGHRRGVCAFCRAAGRRASPSPPTRPSTPAAPS